MTKHIKTEGIVLKETPLGENGKLLVFFTKEYGKISVAAKGVKKPGSSLVQLSQLFAYSRLELYKGNSSLYTLTGGTLIEPFFGLSEDFERISAAGQMIREEENRGKLPHNFLRTDGYVIQEDFPDEETLRLFLNSLYFISTGKRKPEFIKSIFMLKMMQYQGILPEVQEIEEMWRKKLMKGTVNALEHILSSEIGDLFAFGVSDIVYEELESIAEMFSFEIN